MFSPEHTCTVKCTYPLGGQWHSLSWIWIDIWSLCQLLVLPNKRTWTKKLSFTILLEETSYFNTKRVEGIMWELKRSNVLSYIKSHNFVFVFVILPPMHECFVVDCHQSSNQLLGATLLPSSDVCSSEDFWQRTIPFILKYFQWSGTHYL